MKQKLHSLKKGLKLFGKESEKVATNEIKGILETLQHFIHYSEEKTVKVKNDYERENSVNTSFSGH